MKKALILFLSFIVAIPSFAQFKTNLKEFTQNSPRFGTIADVTNPKGDLPGSGAINVSTPFNFESIEKKSIELGNISNVVPLWSTEREIPLAIYGAVNTIQENPASDIEEITYNYLESVKKYLGVDDVRNRFVIQEIQEDNEIPEITHVRLKQYFMGLYNYGGEILVHIKNGQVYFLNGYWYPETPSEFNQVKSRTNPQIKDIVRSDLKTFSSYRNLNAFEQELLGTDQWHIEQVYYKSEENEDLSLHWKVEVHPNLAEEWVYFIKDGSDRITHKHQKICKLHHNHKLNDHEDKTLLGGETAWALDLLGNNQLINVYSQGGTYYLMDASRDMYNTSQSSMPNDPVGVIWTLDARNSSPENDNFNVEQISTSNNSWNDKVAVSAHYNAQQAYEYYKNTFSRNSINGQGGNIISLINVVNADGSEMDNAFWSGKAMFYGNGNEAFSPLAGSLDVAGHEMTHGVIQSTANLEYYGESGAINESYADVFGCMIDRDDWKLGEDVVYNSVFSSGALRDMSDPHNGGNSLNDNGYQPAHVNEQYTGQQDNGGVHINSGIPNYAFYKFATALNSKEKAEQIYYKALSSYLTKSSKFVDLRVAIEQAAYDLYGTAEKDAASNAFEAVGIQGGSSSGGNNYQNDLAVNPGNDYILYYNEMTGNLALADGNGDPIQDPLSTTPIYSKPSISDNGADIVFVGQDNMIHYIFIDWASGQYEESIIQNEAIWRNAIVSKDGWRIAALTEDLNNLIHVFDFGVGSWNEYEIYTPSTVEGHSAGDVDYVDEMEFNYSGEWIMYDAQNTIQSDFGNDIEYWDIGFVNVFNNGNGNFADGLIQKLFSGLPENTSIGNPTFSKNSPYIIAFDYLIGNNDYYIVGSNLETGEVNQIYTLLSLGYPNYSRMDNELLFDYTDFWGSNVAILGVDDSKITYQPNTDKLLIENASWGVWFSNGIRDLVLDDGLVNINENKAFNISPNPSNGDYIVISGSSVSGSYQCKIHDILGNVHYAENVNLQSGENRINLGSTFIPNGSYFLVLQNEDTLLSKKLMIRR